MNTASATRRIAAIEKNQRGTPGPSAKIAAASHTFPRFDALQARAKRELWQEERR
jgi:hypothetical protein